MREIFENALTSWDKYWDGSFYPYLLLGAALYLLLFERKRKKAGYLLGYLGITLFLFFCPLTSALIQKCIGSMVYWRAIWLLPAVPVMACAFTGLAGKIRNAGLQIIPVVLCLTLVIFCGTSVWQAGNYVKVANRQKVPEEAAQAAEVICRREVRRTVWLWQIIIWHLTSEYMILQSSLLSGVTERAGVPVMENDCMNI